MKPQIKMGSSITDYHQVRLSPTAMLSPYASVCGDVRIGAESSVFAGTHVRGDCEPIEVGARTNIQENSCLHVSLGSPLRVGDHVTVGHGVTLHGCTICDNVLVGMGSTVMDDAVIASNCVIGAGSLVTQGKRFEEGTLLMGRPARAVRRLSDEEIERMVTVAADAYVDVARAMTDDGLMMRPPAGTTVWPPAPAGLSSAAPLIFGAAF